VVGALLLKITAKKASMNRKFPFTVQSGYVYFKRKSFVYVPRKVFNPVGHPAVCFLHFTAECFTQALYEKSTRKYLKPGPVPAVTSYLSGIVQWWANIYLPFVLTSHVR